MLILARGTDVVLFVHRDQRRQKLIAQSNICLSFVESAKRRKPKIIKKAPVSEDMIKAIIDKIRSQISLLIFTRVSFAMIN